MTERTALSPDEEQAFQSWARANGITDVDAPQSRYDYRGYWKNVASQGGDQTQAYADGRHFPDTYKQHGHPTFSQESQYSAGPWDGGRWVGEDFIPPGADMMQTSRGARLPQAEMLRLAVIASLKGQP